MTAENAYFADTLLDSLEIREPLMTLARPPIGIGAYNPQIGGGLIGSGPVTITGTISGQAPALSGVEGQPLPVSYVPNDFEKVKREKVYEMKNHLGNVLLVVTDLKLGQEEGSPDDTTDYYLPETVAANDYYPEACPERRRRGMPMVGRTWQAGTYRYGFQGQEGDGDWGMYDFGARAYSAQLGRWISVDPLANSRSSWSTFNSMRNNPLINIDPNGMRDDHYIDESGNYLGSDGDPNSNQVRVIDREKWNNLTQGAGLYAEEVRDQLQNGDISTPLNEYPSSILFPEATRNELENKGAAIPTEWLRNNSSTTAYFKPENGSFGLDNSGAYPIGPGESLFIQIDGITVTSNESPAIFKVSTGLSAYLDSEGNPHTNNNFAWPWEWDFIARGAMLATGGMKYGDWIRSKNAHTEQYTITDGCCGAIRNRTIIEHYPATDLSWNALWDKAKKMTSK